MSLGVASVRETYGVATLAVRKPTGWRLVPGGSVTLAAGDELFAVGGQEALTAFQEAVA